MRAGFSSIYRKIHYIEICYIKVWVYLYNLEKVLGMCKNCSSEKAFFILRWRRPFLKVKEKYNYKLFSTLTFWKKSFWIQDFGNYHLKVYFLRHNFCVQRLFLLKELQKKTKILGSNFSTSFRKGLSFITIILYHTLKKIKGLRLMKWLLRVINQGIH